MLQNTRFPHIWLYRLRSTRFALYCSIGHYFSIGVTRYLDPSAIPFPTGCSHGSSNSCQKHMQVVPLPRPGSTKSGRTPKSSSGSLQPYVWQPSCFFFKICVFTRSNQSVTNGSHPSHRHAAPVDPSHTCWGYPEGEASTEVFYNTHPLKITLVSQYRPRYVQLNANLNWCSQYWCTRWLVGLSVCPMYLRSMRLSQALLHLRDLPLILIYSSRSHPVDQSIPLTGQSL